MKFVHPIIRFLTAAAIAAGIAGCAEIKVGAGPFKAMSVEVGPGGAEAKGPSAGPFKTHSVEIDSKPKKKKKKK